jgi:hypothetical protein
MPRRYRYDPEIGANRVEEYDDADTTPQIRKEEAREVKAGMEPEMSLAMVPHPTVGVMPPEYTKETKKPRSFFGKVSDLFHTASRYITPELVLGIANAAKKTGSLKGNFTKDALSAANFLKGVKHPGAQGLAGVVGAIPAVAGIFGKGKEVAGQVPGAVNMVKERYFGANGAGRPPTAGKVAPQRMAGTSTAMVPYTGTLATARQSLGRVR